MKITEIYKSIQGESSFVGLPCVFVRVSGCNLRCRWCDTKYAWEGGEEISIDEILNRIKGYNCSLVEITGGEPLLQNDTGVLTKRLVDNNHQVLIETNGSLDIGGLDERIIRIIDLKCPDSGMSERMRWENMSRLRPTDEVKFVLSSRRDYEWSVDVINRYSLADRLSVLLSIAFNNSKPIIEPKEVCNWILEDNLKVRFALQLHKLIWGDIKGV